LVNDSHIFHLLVPRIEKTFVALTNDRPNNATPTRERCVTSYPTRRRYRPGVVFPPAVPGVADMYDIHCHAHDGQQDALALAKLASQSGMRGIVYKTIGGISGEYRPAHDVAAVQDALDRWAEAEGVTPIACFAGYGITMDNRPPSMERLRLNIADGISAVWLPVFNHANTLNTVGGLVRWWDPTAQPGEHSEPLPWDLAVERGYYMLDGNGKLKDEYAEYIRVIADAGVPLYTGHATHPEIWALVDLCDRLGFRQTVIDHPFSPFIDLTINEMHELTARGVTMNFTFDELSPLLGIDPAKMYAAIRSVGPQHCTLSSDAGEPLFPHSVECMRLISGYMAAFGMTPDELRVMCTTNPERLFNVKTAENHASV
jgi:hypothetical protein